MTRETIYTALAARLTSACSGLLSSTVMRRLVDYDNVRPELQPALICISDSDSQSTVDPLPQTWQLSAKLYIYARCSAELTDSAEPTLHAIIDAIDAGLKLQTGESGAAPFAMRGRAQTTLGGLVHSVYIDGAIQYYDGANGLQGIAIVPITMIVPSL